MNKKILIVSIVLIIATLIFISGIFIGRNTISNTDRKVEENTISNIKLAITLKDGTKEDITLLDLKNEFEGNSAYIQKKYSGASISFEGIIKKIEDASTISFGGVSTGTYGLPYDSIYEVTLEDNISLYLKTTNKTGSTSVQSDIFNIEELSAGTKIKVNSNISYLYLNEESGKLWVHICSYDGGDTQSNWNTKFGTVPTTVSVIK